ncbi:hypothetical protein CYMTET_45369 [Cymbomonas tetramitiformis]|uniref:Uncharacterized protein n=1 Tax=Cymbomonas tetramitiformis TaxID=36881 RepID=A0AAE0BZN8_9CHLO|nr:hypothetical protein CYMTET_45369 [Cymbomonas tetramitiformis]
MADVVLHPSLRGLRYTRAMENYILDHQYAEPAQNMAWNEGRQPAANVARLESLNSSELKVVPHQETVQVHAYAWDCKDTESHIYSMPLAMQKLRPAWPSWGVCGADPAPVSTGIAQERHGRDNGQRPSKEQCSREGDDWNSCTKPSDRRAEQNAARSQGRSLASRLPNAHNQPPPQVRGQTSYVREVGPEGRSPPSYPGLRNGSRPTERDPRHQRQPTYEDHPRHQRQPRYDDDPRHQRQPRYDDDPRHQRQPGYDDDPRHQRQPRYEDDPRHQRQPRYDDDPRHQRQPRYDDDPRHQRQPLHARDSQMHIHPASQPPPHAEEQPYGACGAGAGDEPPPYSSGLRRDDGPHQCNSRNPQRQMGNLRVVH